MDPRWGLFVLVAVCLLQLPAVLLLARRVELGGELPWRPGYAHADADGGRLGQGTPPDPPRAVCPACGTANDDDYAYCRRCAGRL